MYATERNIKILNYDEQSTGVMKWLLAVTVIIVNLLI